VFPRYSGNRPRGTKPQWKRCDWRKSLAVREGGKTAYVSGKSRCWEQAEKAERGRFGGQFTVTATVVEAVVAPDVAVTVTV
jgi:hypothetical protein